MTSRGHFSGERVTFEGLCRDFRRRPTDPIHSRFLDSFSICRDLSDLSDMISDPLRRIVRVADHARYMGGGGRKWSLKSLQSLNL